MYNPKGRIFQAELEDGAVLIRAFDLDHAEEFLSESRGVKAKAKFAHDFEIEELRKLGTPEYDAMRHHGPVRRPKPVG